MPDAGLLTPQQLADIIAGAIKESRFTAEEMNELKKPYIDHAAEKRKLETRRSMQQQQREMIEADELRKRNCPHERRERNGNTTDKIMLVHNFPDGLTRGICLLCRDVFQPAHYERINGKPTLVAAHPQYQRVVNIETAEAQLA